MELKHDIVAITNGYIGQLHYAISVLNNSKEKNFSKEFEGIIGLTSKFQERIKHEYKRAK
jgi:hypothetical protein